MSKFVLNAYPAKALAGWMASAPSDWEADSLRHGRSVVTLSQTVDITEDAVYNAGAVAAARPGIACSCSLQDVDDYGTGDIDLAVSIPFSEGDNYRGYRAPAIGTVTVVRTPAAPTTSTSMVAALSGGLWIPAPPPLGSVFQHLLIPVLLDVSPATDVTIDVIGNICINHPHIPLITACGFAQ